MGEETLKQMSKMVRQHGKDVDELKKLLEDPNKVNKKEADHLINRMIVRTETLWQDLRGLGRALNS